jgi:hypothetical protein
MLRTDSDDPRREIGLHKVDVGDDRHRENSIKLLRPDDTAERTDVPPVIPDAEKSASLMACVKPVLPHLGRNREGRAVAAHNEKMNLPASPNPAVAEIRDHPLGAAAEVHTVDVDTDPHIRERRFAIRR